ncbi:MAG: hypothetical protein JJE30_11240 [Desulfuromonadales bacterium]|nr:hypothetical protein [Desulfuromonadales bacterium]
MKVYALATIEVANKEVPQGSFIDISETDLPDFSGKIAYIKDGVLRVPRHVASLEELIVGLTTDDLVMQKQFLIKHCQSFNGKSIQDRLIAWTKRAASIELDKHVSKKEAEIEAARELNLLAFLDDRQD